MIARMHPAHALRSRVRMRIVETKFETTPTVTYARSVIWTAQIYTVAIVKAGMPPSVWIFLLIAFQFNSDIVTGKPQKCISQYRFALIAISIMFINVVTVSIHFRKMG